MCVCVCVSSATSHLHKILLDKVVYNAPHLRGSLMSRHNLASLCMFYMIRNNSSDPVVMLIQILRVVHIPILSESPWARQISRTFIPAVVFHLNSLSEISFDDQGLASSKASDTRALLANFGRRLFILIYHSISSTVLILYIQSSR